MDVGAEGGDQMGRGDFFFLEVYSGSRDIQMATGRHVLLLLPALTQRTQMEANGKLLTYR